MRTRKYSLTLLVGVLVSTQASPVNAQQRDRQSVDRTEAVSQLNRMPGQVVSRGTNDQPTGELNLKSYVLEELRLTQPLEVEIRGERTQIDRGWRLSITGGPFTVRAMPAIVWVADKAVGIGIESPDLKRISVIIFDRELLRDGAPIALSYGEHDPQRTELPERLILKPAR